MPSRPIIPARQIQAVCAALRPGQRAEITMPGGGMIRICGASMDGEPADQDSEAKPAELPAATVHELGALVRQKLASQRQA
jgi:hypothetical protein